MSPFLDINEFIENTIFWNKCTIDRFASLYNNPHERFNSKVWTPGTEKIDAFSQF
jgi:hypothetical protein